MTGPLAAQRLGYRIFFCGFLLSFVAAGATQALTYAMISDENLADQASAIAEVDILSVAAVADAPFPMVEYEVLVERARPANSTAAQISSIQPGATIRFRVRAEKKSRWSDWSEVVTVQMPN